MMLRDLKQENKQDSELKIPHNIEAEQALLGALLLNNTVFDKVGETLKPEHFYEGLHSRIYSTIASMINGGQVASPTTLKTYFDGQETSMQLPITISQYLGRLSANGIIYGVEEIANQIRDLYLRRELIQLSSHISEMASESVVDFTAGEQIEEIEQRLFDLSGSKSQKHNNLSVYDASMMAIENLDNDSGLIKTGLKSLDNYIGGLVRGELALLGGRPGMGKTTVATSLALRMAKLGYGVFIQSFEMNSESLAHRLLSDLNYSSTNPIEYNRIRRRDLSDYEKRSLRDSAEELRSLPLHIDDQRGIAVPQIRSKIRHVANDFARKGKSLDVVIVDHLGLVRPSGRYAGHKVNELGEVCDELCTLGKELDVANLALHQLNRGVEYRDNKRPTLSDLRDSGNLEQDADLILFAYRHAYYLEKNKFDDPEKEVQRLELLEKCRNDLELMIGKQRNGATGIVTANGFMSSSAVRDRI